MSQTSKMCIKWNFTSIISSYISPLRMHHNLLIWSSAIYKSILIWWSLHKDPSKIVFNNVDYTVDLYIWDNILSNTAKIIFHRIYIRMEWFVDWIVLIPSYPHVNYSLQGIKYKLQVELQHTLKIRYHVNI